MTTARNDVATPSRGDQRINAPAEPGDLERRWSLVRTAMTDAQVDALFVHSHVDGIGSATRWFADVPGGAGYPVSLVFPRDAPMTLITHGPFGGDRTVDPGDPTLFGIGRVMTTPSFASVGYCTSYDGELALEALLELNPGRVGIVAAGSIPHPMLEHIKRGLAGCDVVDASEFVDPIKAIKSPVEQAMIRATAAMQDAALDYAFSIVEPGMRDSDVAAEVQRYCQTEGSEGGIYMVGSAPLGEPASFNVRHSQNRVIQPGDQFTFVVENSGAGGFYSHVGRTAIFGKAPKRLRDEHEFALEAQQRVVEMLRPGADPAEIAQAYDEYMRTHGRPPEHRLLAHGQGFDLVERPLIRGDETMPLAAGMNIGVHPMYVNDGVFGYVCDNYLIGDEKTERIHNFPQIVVEL